ncbi:MAG: alcohol dehydrogenase [Myxococcales bacterium]|nr:alcohol dehydrogenase [Myxococcales bacterium]
MKALVLQEKGQLPVFGEQPHPVATSGEALVRVAAAALNHRDIWIMHGQYPGITLPIILGSDGTGRVESVCDGEESWVGQDVIINPSIGWGDNPEYQANDFTILGLPRSGTFAEYISVPIENLVPKPDHLTAPQAAALPLAGLTAWRALVTRAQAQAGDKVLISGVGGGVALFAAQFAIALGCEVYVTSGSDSKIEQATDLGAAGGVNYRSEDFLKEASALSPKGFDIVIDSAGGEGFGDLVRLLGPGGRLAFYGGTCGRWPTLLPQHMFYKQVSILATTMGSPKDFSDMVAFINTTKLVPVVDRVFTAKDGDQAFSHLDSGKQFGKVVLSFEETT